MTETLSMRERIARALAAKAGEDFEARSIADTLSGNEPEDMRNGWRDLADAALEAMREPSEAVVQAGVVFALSAIVRDWPTYIRGLHGRMIDAAIREGKDANG